MPIVRSLMDKLVKEYGKERGERVYYAMEASGKGPFAKGAKHHDLHESFAAKHGLPALSGSAKRKAKTKKGAAMSRRPPKRRKR